jgi:hypothetical protein
MRRPSEQKSDRSTKSLLDLVAEWDSEICVETETEGYIIREILVTRDGKEWRERMTIAKPASRAVQ